MNENTLNNQHDDVKRKPPQLPKPKPFHITEPEEEQGLWCFWLTADDTILEYVYNLNCVLTPKSNNSPFGKDTLHARIRFAINPRYDHEETWLWLHDVLTSETTIVELDTNWEDAIVEAQTSSN